MWSRIVVAALAAFSGAVHAQGGYFDFSQVPGVGTEPTVQIDLTPVLLSFVKTAMQTTDPDAADAMSGIENVRVRVYEEVEDPDAVLEFVEDSSGQLERDGWQRMVYIQDDQDKVRVYVKIEEDQPVGLTVMVVDGFADEAVFINIAGKIDPVKLGQVANSIGVGDILGHTDDASSDGPDAD